MNRSDWDCTLEPPPEGRRGAPSASACARSTGCSARRRSGWSRGGRIATVEELRSRGGVPVHAIQRLAAADAFRSMGLDRRAALWDSRALQAGARPAACSLMPRRATKARKPSRRSFPAMPLAEHVVNDYQTIRLSLKAHPMRFLREHYAAQKFVTADQLKTIRDGKRLSIAGLVLIRQRPGSAKGVVFITLEDETGIANLVVWPDVFEKQRKIVMGARLMAVHGIVQRDPDSDVIHVVARRLEDHSHMLRHLSDEALPSTLSQGDARRQLAGARRTPPARRRDHPEKPRFPLSARSSAGKLSVPISATKSALEADGHEHGFSTRHRAMRSSPRRVLALAASPPRRRPARRTLDQPQAQRRSSTSAPCGEHLLRHVVKASAKAQANARKGGTEHSSAPRS